MSIYDEQLKNRRISDDMDLSNSLLSIANAVMNNHRSISDNDIADDAVKDICKFYKISIDLFNADFKDANDALNHYCKTNGIFRRTVILHKGWYKDACGVYLGKKKDGQVIALIPRDYSGYTYMDYKTGKRVIVSSKNEDLIDEEAIAFYKTFPMKSLNAKDLFMYVSRLISARSYLQVIIFSIALAVIGLLLPKISNIIFGLIVPNNAVNALMAITTLTFSIIISRLLFQISRDLVVGRISLYVDDVVQSATMERLLFLPAGFFRKYSTGELANRMQCVNLIASTIVNTILSTGLTSICSLIYIFQIYKYAKELFIPSILSIFITILVFVISSIIQISITKKQLEIRNKENGLTYSFINGIEKIKTAGAEKRAFSKWANTYTKLINATYNIPYFLIFNSAIMLAITLISNLVFQVIAYNCNIEVSNYYAFLTAYGLTSGAFLTLSDVALTFAKISPAIDMAMPILSEKPEYNQNNISETKLDGSVDVSHVFFRYDENSPMLFKDLNLSVKKGEYVAIVGKTGCGKSTLIRLLLGFEKAARGAILYNSVNIDNMDLMSFRKNIGVVLQNGKLFLGDIYNNITISVDNPTEEIAWEAAKLAHIDDFILELPMGMKTMVMEGVGNISGGQKQRLLIARAVANKPKVLIFDEATSALDNTTQLAVTNSLKELNCTRIVVAHRLSTIKDCDRIFFIDDGKVAEEGTYDELLNLNGKFKELVQEQIV